MHIPPLEQAPDAPASASRWLATLLMAPSPSAEQTRDVSSALRATLDCKRLTSSSVSQTGWHTRRKAAGKAGKKFLSGTVLPTFFFAGTKWHDMALHFY